METDYALKIPYLMGIIATRSLDKPVLGIRDLMAINEQRIRNGMIAYGLLERLRIGDKTAENIAKFNDVKSDLGYGLLLKKYAPNVSDASEQQIKMATQDTIPQVAPLFWSFRIMVVCGVLMFALIGFSFIQVCRQKIGSQRWLLKSVLWAIPLPWIACEAGWFVAEYGRQPWAIGEVLPVSMATSNLAASDIWISLGAVYVLYTLFLIAEMYLMVKFSRRGPSVLKTGRYYHEQHRSLDNVIDNYK